MSLNGLVDVPKEHTNELGKIVLIALSPKHRLLGVLFVIFEPIAEAYCPLQILLLPIHSVKFTFETVPECIKRTNNISIRPRYTII